MSQTPGDKLVVDFRNVIQTLQAANVDAEKLASGNKSAGVRLRKAMMDARKALAELKKFSLTVK